MVEIESSEGGKQGKGRERGEMVMREIEITKGGEGSGIEGSKAVIIKIESNQRGKPFDRRRNLRSESGEEIIGEIESNEGG